MPFISDHALDPSNPSCELQAIPPDSYPCISLDLCPEAAIEEIHFSNVLTYEFIKVSYSILKYDTEVHFAGRDPEDVPQLKPLRRLRAMINWIHDTQKCPALCLEEVLYYMGVFKYFDYNKILKSSLDFTFPYSDNQFTVKRNVRDTYASMRNFMVSTTFFNIEAYLRAIVREIPDAQRGGFIRNAIDKADRLCLSGCSLALNIILKDNDVSIRLIERQIYLGSFRVYTDVYHALGEVDLYSYLKKIVEATDLVCRQIQYRIDSLTARRLG